jgi:hypothetical protein
MSDFKENNAALKIQFLFKLNHASKLLDEFNNLELKKHAKEKSFDEFKKIIIKKEIIDIAKKFTDSLEKFKKGLNINPRVLITSFLITFYTDELIGDISDRHPSDDYIYTISLLVVEELEKKSIPNLWNLLRDFKLAFANWSKMDKDRTIERLIVSYYYRCEHIEQINNKEIVRKFAQFNEKQQEEMKLELEKQKSDICRSIKLIDKTFNLEYLKKNYKQLFNGINQSWEKIKTNVSDTMKKAYYNMLIEDVNNGNLLSCFNLLKEIGERLGVICPIKQSELFKEKFSEDNLHNVLSVCEFSSELKNFVIFMIDFIILMDAPINDKTNNEWKKTVVQSMNNNDDFAQNFPKILIQIEEHIDIIYDLIIKLNQ